MSPQSPPVIYDAATREHRISGAIVDQQVSSNERAKSFADREDEWERFCEAHKADDALSRAVIEHAKQQLRDNYGDKV